MNAVYARQSVDRADSISIESQIEFCSYEMRGEAYKVYADRGYSGKNTDRPAFAEMMRGIEEGVIGRVVVYKLDRISRSILDFSNMMEKFEKYGVEFVSTTEKFDTSSPIGRAMLSICIVFAQLERETIQKRVADAYYSRSQKSLYMGGRAPYGFRLVPACIGGVRTSRYEPKPGEAEQVRLIYELYADPDCSCGDIARRFWSGGVLKDGKPWARARIADILRNPIYVRADLSIYKFYRRRGTDIVNGPADFIGTNGCYFYKGKGSNTSGGYLVLAPHEGLVSSELWLRCREKCLLMRQVSSHQKASKTWLAGKIKCGVCGYALVDKRFPGSETGYLICSNKMNTGSCKGPGTIFTEELEKIVLGEMLEKLRQLGIRRRDCRMSAVPAGLKARLAENERETETLIRRLTDDGETPLQCIRTRLNELEGERRELMRCISREEMRGETACAELDLRPESWNEISFDDRRRVLESLIRVIYSAGDRVRIEWLI